MFHFFNNSSISCYCLLVNFSLKGYSITFEKFKLLCYSKKSGRSTIEDELQRLILY